MSLRQKLVKIFMSAVENSDPYYLIKSNVSIKANNEVDIFGRRYGMDKNFYVVGFGKAVLKMSHALQDTLGKRINCGVLSVPEKSVNVLPQAFSVITGAKDNLPDLNSCAATDQIIDLTKKVTSKDILIVLISGGGSSLLCKPQTGVTLDDKLHTIKLLTQSGADITELNTVRKKLSYVKGGGLANYCSNFESLCLVLSDVIGDPINIIASGPMSTDEETEEAIDVIRKYRLEFKIPKHILNILQEPSEKIGNEKSNITHILIGSNKLALDAAKSLEESEDFRVIIASSCVQGLVTSVSKFYADFTLELLKFLVHKDGSAFLAAMRVILRANSMFSFSPTLVQDIINASSQPSTEALCFLLGGETTVLLTGSGKGGRNQHLAVLLSQHLHSLRQKHPELFTDYDVEFLSAGTDGIDGPTDAAGAVGSANLIDRGLEAGLDVDVFLANNDCYNFLSAVDGGQNLIKIGHTGTNVMDIHALIVQRQDKFKS